jgi:hypothetical protein
VLVAIIPPIVARRAIRCCAPLTTSFRDRKARIDRDFAETGNPCRPYASNPHLLSIEICSVVKNLTMRNFGIADCTIAFRRWRGP